MTTKFDQKLKEVASMRCQGNLGHIRDGSIHGCSECDAFLAGATASEVRAHYEKIGVMKCIESLRSNGAMRTLYPPEHSLLRAGVTVAEAASWADWLASKFQIEGEK